MTHTDHFYEIATSVSDKLAGQDDVQAVFLVGSTATGDADEYSDVDLQVVGPDEPGEQFVDNVHIEWNPVTAEEIKQKLGDWEDDAALYTYANAELLYDQIGLADLLATFDTYPASVRRKKLYAGWFYGTGDTFDARKAAERGDTRVKQCAAVSAVEQFIALTYLLEGQFPPYRKWLFRDLPRTVPDIDAALTGDVEALTTIMNELKAELRDILDNEQIEKPYLHQPEFGPLG